MRNFETTKTASELLGYRAIAEVCPETAALIAAEGARQASCMRLIASENYTSRAVMAATGSVFTNKYSEGYPGHRYYEGNIHVDRIENLCIERAKLLFGADHANVQPLSGAPANLAVYLAFVKPGETILGMGLSAGGHLTHGHNVSISGKFFRAVRYGVRRDTGRIDYDEVRDLALRERPRLIWAGGTAVPRIIDFPAFHAIAQEVGAILVADTAHISGLIAGGVHPSPVPWVDVVSTTTNKTLRGPRGGMILCRAEHARAIDAAVFPGLQGGPHNHQTAALAVALHEAGLPSFRAYAQRVVDNARSLANALLERGFDLISGGTDNHLILCDLMNKNVSGRSAARALARANIILNCNAVPFDPRKPFDPSGIRLGTAAVSTRGMGREEMLQLAAWIDRVLQKPEDEALHATIGAEVRALCAGFPVPAAEGLVA